MTDTNTDNKVPVGDDEIVGHKTFYDDNGRIRHEPLTHAEGLAIMAACDAARARRAELYPTADDAVRGMWDAWQRLTELGWKDARYAPADGETKRVIEPGSSGIHDAQCESRPAPREHEKWWWSHSHGDVWPIKPILYLPSDAENAEREARVAAFMKGQQDG
jgi:hypothetical protein